MSFARSSELPHRPPAQPRGVCGFPIGKIHNLNTFSLLAGNQNTCIHELTPALQLCNSSRLDLVRDRLRRILDEDNLISQLDTINGRPSHTRIRDEASDYNRLDTVQRQLRVQRGKLMVLIIGECRVRIHRVILRLLDIIHRRAVALEVMQACLNSSFNLRAPGLRHTVIGIHALRLHLGRRVEEGNVDGVSRLQASMGRRERNVALWMPVLRSDDEGPLMVVKQLVDLGQDRRRTRVCKRAVDEVVLDIDQD